MNFIKPLTGLLVACVLTVPVLFMGLQDAQAVDKTSKSRQAFVRVDRGLIENFPSSILDDNVYNQMIKEAEGRAKRTTATADSFDESRLSDEYRNLRSEIIGGKEYLNGKETGKTIAGVTTADQLSALVDKYDKDDVIYGLPRDAQLMAIQLVSIKPFKGFIYRAQKYFGKHSAIRTMIVSSLRLTAQGINVFLPTEQWTAGFAYVTEPFADMGRPINSDADLEYFIAKTLFESVTKNTKRIELWAKNIEPIYWDNKVYFSKAKFLSEKDRYLRLGVAEQHAIASASWATLASISSLSAYSLQGLADSVKDISKHFGIDSSAVANVFGDGPMGVSSKERFAILKNYPNLFVKVSQPHMVYAFGAWRSSARWARSAWIELKNSAGKIETSQTQIQNVIDPNGVMPFSRIVMDSLNNMDLLLDGKKVEAGIALVQGEAVEVDLYKFFHESPDMSELYPVAFDDSHINKKKVINNKKVEFRNYLSGTPTAWNYEVYKRYFPDAMPSDKKDQTKDVTKFARVLSQTWGGWIVGLPLSALVF
jgi:hypothetical protein